MHGDTPDSFCVLQSQGSATVWGSLLASVGTAESVGTTVGVSILSYFLTYLQFTIARIENQAGTFLPSSYPLSTENRKIL